MGETDTIENENEMAIESGSPTTLTALEILKDLDDPKQKTKPHDGFLAKIDPDDPACAKWGREQMEVLKLAALDSRTVYSYLFVQSAPFSIRAVSGWLLVVISIVVQVVIPLSIVVTLQPVASIEENKICPRRSNGLTKFLAFMLSIYFVVLTLGLCTNKLRGLRFLHDFVFLDPKRKICINVGILSQCIGIFVASLAQYLLFIGNGDSYVRLLLQSLAMQFCLTVDQNIVNHQLGAWTEKRLEAITSDKCLAKQYGGMGEDLLLPAGTLKQIASIVNAEKCVLVGFVVIGVFFSVGLAVCM